MTRYAEYRAAAARQAEAVLSRASHRAAGDYSMGGGSVAVGLSDAIGGQYIDSDAALLYQRNKGWVYSSIRPIARTVAGLRFQVGMRTASKPAKGERVTRAMKSTLPRHLKDLPGDVVLLENNPLLDVLARPNLLMVGWHLKYITVVNLELIGKAYWWLTLSAERKPVIWPLPVSWVMPLHENGKPFAKWRITPGGTGTPFTVDAEEIVYFYYPDPANTLMAKSPAGAQMRAIIADENIQEAQARAFSNGLWPGLAIIAGDVTDIDSGESQGRPLLEGEQRSQLTAMIRKHYASVTHFKEPLILDALIKDVKPLSNTPHEMDFLDSSTLSKSRVTQGHGVNPAIMGEIEGLNRASSHSARLHFGEFTVNPLAELISETLTATIGARMSPPGMQLLVYLESYRPDDSAETRADMQLLVNARAITRNELRMRLGNMPPMEGAGEDMVMMPTEQIVPITGIPPMAEEEPEEEKPEEEDDDDPDESGRSFLTRRRKGMSRERYVAEARRLWEEDQLAAETRVAGAVFTLFRQQEADIMQRLESLWSDVDGDIRHLSAETAAEMIFDPRAWTQRWRAALLPLAGDIAVTGAVSERSLVLAASKTIELIELDPQVVDAVNAEIETWMDRPYWGDVQATTRQQLVATLQEGFANGDSLYQLMTRIGDNPTVAAPPGLFGPGTTFGYNPILGSGPSTARASLIARTECLTGDVPVSSARAVAAHKRWYRGEVVEIVTESGRKLTGTPNHPMLTQRGWVALGELSEGDYLVCDSRNVEELRAAGDKDVATPPAAISELFDSLSAVGVAMRKATGKPDFHGDGQNGYVDVHLPDRILRVGDFIPINERSIQSLFSPADMVAVDAVLTAAKRNPFARGLPINAIHAFGKCSQRHTGFEDRLPYAASKNAVCGSELARALPGQISSHDFIDREFGPRVLIAASEQGLSGLTQRPSRHSRAIECRVDWVRLAAELSRDFSDAQSGAVKLDRLCGLRRIKDWSGHVFNLTTVDGYYSAGGLYTGNTTGWLNAGHDKSQLMLAQEGVIAKKEWSAILDQYTRTGHYAADGQKVEVSKPFMLSDPPAQGMYPGHYMLPAAHRCNCRCTVLSVLNEHLDPGKPRRSARRLTYA